MSSLLDEIIAARIPEAYRRTGEESGRRPAEDTPQQIDTPGRRALYNNLGRNGDLALKIDEVVRNTRPDGWRGIQARERVIKAALYGVLQNEDEVERIFLIVKQQRES
jgi:type I restriction enzyme R subunit